MFNKVLKFLSFFYTKIKHIFIFLWREFIKDVVVWGIRVLDLKFKKPYFISSSEYKKLIKCPGNAYSKRKKWAWTQGTFINILAYLFFIKFFWWGSCFFFVLCSVFLKFIYLFIYCVVKTIFDFGFTFKVAFLEGIREAEKKPASYLHSLVVFYLNVLVRDLAFRLNPFFFILGFSFLIFIIFYNLFDRDLKRLWPIFFGFLAPYIIDFYLFSWRKINSLTAFIKNKYFKVTHSVRKGFRPFFYFFFVFIPYKISIALANRLKFYNWFVFKLKRNRLTKSLSRIHRFFHRLFFSYPLKWYKKLKKKGFFSTFFSYFCKYGYPYTKFIWRNGVLFYFLYKRMSLKMAILCFLKISKPNSLKSFLFYFYLEVLRFFKQGWRKHLSSIWVRLVLMKIKYKFNKCYKIGNSILKSFFFYKIFNFSFKNLKSLLNILIVKKLKKFSIFLDDFSNFCLLLNNQYFFISFIFIFIYLFLKFFFFALFYVGWSVIDLKSFIMHMVVFFKGIPFKTCNFLLVFLKKLISYIYKWKS